jgi:hypothetical protein
MDTLKEIELSRRSVRVTWCACERCQALGPRSISYARHGIQCTVTLSSECCLNASEDPDDMRVRLPLNL